MEESCMQLVGCVGLLPCITTTTTALPVHMNNPEAPLFDSTDCSAHVRSRWLFDCITAVLPKHAKILYLRMRL